MKTLILLRHAKSSWEDPQVSDRDRALNNRGRRDAPRMAQRLALHYPTIDCVLCSSARRCKETVEVFLNAVRIDWNRVNIADELYLAGPDHIVRSLQRLPEEVDKVLYVGHNPGVTLVANKLANLNISNVPTCGMVVLQFERSDWADLNYGIGEMLTFEYPKMLPETG